MIQLIYSSVSCLKEAGENIEHGVTRVISQSFINNKRRGVTGILLHANGLFLQLLEGPDAAIEEAMGYIARDQRHKDVCVISKRPVDYYSLPYSPMASAGINESLPADVTRAIAAARSDAPGNAAKVVRDYLLSQAKRDDLDERLQALSSNNPLEQSGRRQWSQRVRGLVKALPSVRWLDRGTAA
ncbi:MAG: BLUF domain-containing protein [Halieaceae bacterium]|jgi:hypothetical protein|nr:BLUF domain-containing protein [Halieaceae bacterium]